MPNRIKPSTTKNLEIQTGFGYGVKEVTLIYSKICHDPSPKCELPCAATTPGCIIRKVTVSNGVKSKANNEISMHYEKNKKK